MPWPPFQQGHRAVLAAGEVPRLFVVEAEYAARMLEAELGWVEEITGDITTGRLTWPEPATGWVRAQGGAR